jgi:hypothetical protein
MVDIVVVLGREWKSLPIQCAGCACVRVTCALQHHASWTPLHQSGRTCIALVPTSEKECLASRAHPTHPNLRPQTNSRVCAKERWSES